MHKYGYKCIPNSTGLVPQDLCYCAYSTGLVPHDLWYYTYYLPTSLVPQDQTISIYYFNFIIVFFAFITYLYPDHEYQHAMTVPQSLANLLCHVLLLIICLYCRLLISTFCSQYDHPRPSASISDGGGDGTLAIHSAIYRTKNMFIYRSYVLISEMHFYSWLAAVCRIIRATIW